MIYPVHTVDEAYGACYPDEPLETNDSRYVDLNEARGGDRLTDFIADRIRRTPVGRFHQQLVSGHRGCGKSTELQQLKALLERNGYFVVYFDAEAALDLSEIKYQDVLVAITKAVEQTLRENDIELNPKLRHELDLWFADHILLEEKRTDWEASLKTEFGVDAKIPLLRVLAAIAGQIKSGSSRRDEIRLKLDRELGVFLDRLNTLIEAARSAVQLGNFHDLVVIVDGLEKMQFREEKDGRSNHSILFIDHAEHLNSPRCHIVYTVPIFLAHNDNLRDSFTDEPFILPMVNQNSDIGKAALRQIVSRRVVIEEVFSDPANVDSLIALSGGSVRDLLRLVRSSCEGASDVIRPNNVERAINRMTIELDRLLQDEDMEALVEVARKGIVTSYKVAGKLLRLRLVHEYLNGERWADIHPILRRIRRVNEALKVISKTTETN
jgi:energy-coupling factor transporter ATP-binding protein EcfA2